MTANFLKPMPLNKPVRWSPTKSPPSARKHTNVAGILNDKDEVLAGSRGIFIAIDPEKMFVNFAER